MELSVQVLGIGIGRDSHISDERALCADLELIKTKRKGVKKYIFEIFLSRSFEMGGSITKLLNQFDD